MSDGTSAPRTRRNLLAGAVGGLGALVLGRLAAPDTASAAAGDNLILGASNDSGTSQTVLNNAGLGAAFTLKTTNAASNATGIFGWSSSTGANSTRGVSGRVDGANSNAVYGNQTGAAGSGAAVYGDGNANTGVVGQSDGGTKYGVHGINTANDGIGVFGNATSTSIDNNASVGVRGESLGDGIFALFFVVPAAGVLGSHQREADSTIAAGVWGEAFDPAADGMRAINWDAGNGASALFSSTLAADDNYAGYFVGNVHVEGALTSTSSTTTLDHPLDPANKFLVHQGISSSERLTIYSGNAKIAANGTATVVLPAWFEALNADVRYQLTVIGKQAQAWVKSGVKGNKFTIASDTPGVTVSWQVSGVRQDAYAKSKAVKVEPAKTGAQKGRYLHPEAHGKAAKLGINYERSGRAAAEKYSKKQLIELRRQNPSGQAS